MQVRWRIVENSGSSISTPFFVVLMLWLAAVFAGFGLSAPRNRLSYIMITLGAPAIASAIYVIVDLDRPFDGIFSVSSQPLRDALTQLSQPVTPKAAFPHGLNDLRIPTGSCRSGMNRGWSLFLGPPS
jgi:hypothetical protein